MAFIAIGCCLVAAAPVPAQSATQDTIGASWTFAGDGGVRYRTEVLATGLRVPWAIAFLPDGRALVTDRPTGQLSLLDVRTRRLTPVAGVPPVHGQVDGGLLDVVVHPDYGRNGWIYFSYAIATDSGNTTVVDRARLRDNQLVDRR